MKPDRIALAFLFPLVLTSADMKIDHVTVAGPSLAALQAALERLGIPAVYGGKHSNGATEMAVTSFPDGSYLELMGFQDGGDPHQKEHHTWAKFLREGAGPCAWAVREDNLAAEVHRLQVSGIPVSAPEKNGRQRPDGVRLEWETSDVGGGTRGAFFPFLIHDFTPHDQRAFPQGRPVTQEFRSVARVVIAVKNLDDSVRRFQQAYPKAKASRQDDADFGAHLAHLSGLPVVLAQPLSPDSWLGKRLARFGEVPCAFLLEAPRPNPHASPSSARWFGGEISWFDADKLGWRLGVWNSN
jgi:hypothetical protein